MSKRDYWLLSNNELDELASKYNVAVYRYKDNPQDTTSLQNVPRKEIIDQLVARDCALDTNIAKVSMYIASVAALVTVIFTLLNILIMFKVI